MNSRLFLIPAILATTAAFGAPADALSGPLDPQLRRPRCLVTHGLPDPRMRTSRRLHIHLRRPPSMRMHAPPPW